MEIRSTLTNASNQVLEVIYKDVNSELDLDGKKIKGVHAYCFCGDKLVLVYADKKGYWTPPGGSVEDGEDVRTAVRREVKEETNMNVLNQRLIGCQDITEPGGVVSQTRSVCIVEPDGPFTSDPDGEVTKIELIDPKDFKKYFDWGEIGAHIMQRALELKVEMDLELNVTRIFDAPCELVWKAWTTPEQIARWFAPGIVMDVRELDVRPGGHFRFADPDEPNAGEYTGTYVTVEPLKELSFQVVDFSETNDPAGVSAAFKVEFEKLGEQTRMTLTSIPPENSYDQRTFDAWTACFERLAKGLVSS